MRKIFLIFTACLIAIAGFSAIKPEAEEFSAYILIEAETKTILEEENSDVKLNCGYLSKLMSLVVIADAIETGKFSLNDTLTAPSAVSGLKGSVIWLEQGDKLSVDELLKAVIIGNANDALATLAVASHQTIEDFTSEMNSRAFDIGLRSTAFYSPFGYYNEKEHTTAHDLALICSELSHYDFLQPYFKIWRDFIKDGSTELVSENTLTRTYKNHIGFKAAHSEQSGYCIAEGGVSDDGNKYIAVILGADSEETSFSLAKKLLNKAFTQYKVTVTGFPDEFLIPINVKNGTESAAELELKSQSSIVIPKGTYELTNKVILPDYISAPVKKGQKIGSIGFYNKDTLVYETDIIVKDSVPKADFGFVFKRMLSNLFKK